MSEIETDDSCSESNQSPCAQFSDSIVSLFPPAGSQSDSSSSQNYEIIIPNNPSLSTTPKSNNSSKSNRTPPKFSHSILSFFSAAKPLTNSSKPRLTILKTGFEVLMKFKVKKEFLFKMLFEATKNFSDNHWIGKGSFFSVYHATLDDGREVAVKCENSAHSCEIDSKALYRLSHKNLVCFLGFCEDSIKHRICVYQYMTNGSLHDHLHKLRSSPLMSSWATRIKVALDAAKGIEYLHVHAETPIIHRNIKSSNILLDAMWTAKVSDFCHFVMPSVIDEMEHLSVLVEMGALAYMDPKYAYNLNVQLTTETDVYSFGVVLLEILSGYMAIYINGNEELQSYIAQNKIDRVLDPKVPPPTPFERKAVAHVGSLALDCVSPNGPERPSMTEIVNSLQRALDACVDLDPEECSLDD
nr:serine/threonine-protein kinase-like protein CCR4 [Quercus suber]